MTFLRTALVALLLNLQPAVTATDGWAAEGSGAVYLTVNNPTMYDTYIVLAASEAAGRIEMRDGDKAVTELTVPAYGRLELKAGGPHLLLIDVKKPLKAGETIEIALTTDAGIVVKVPAPVK